MSLPEIRDRQEGFAGGLNTTADDAALGKNEFRIGRNTQLDVRGAAKKRLGTQYVSSSALASAITGGYAWARTSSTQELVVAGGKLFTGTLSIPMTFTDRGGTMSTTVRPTFAAFKGPSAEGVYIADGGALNFWDGTTLTENIVSTPSVEAIAAWGPRLFAVKDDTLYWSSTTGGINGHTLGAAAGGGQAIVRTYGGQELIALAPLKNSLLLLHRSAISRFTGATTDDINIEAGTNGISGDVGTISRRSTIAVENAVYFLSDRGVFAATETDVQPVSSPIERTLSVLTQGEWAKVVAVHARAFNEIRWWIPGVGIYAFNYRTGGWTGPWDGLYTSSPVAAMWDTRDTNSKPVVLIGNEAGRVAWCDRDALYKDAVLSDGTGGSTYTWVVQCKRFFGGDYTLYKSWRTLYVLGEFPDPENVTVTIRTDGGDNVIPLPYSVSQVGLDLTWGDPSTTWGAPGTVWGGESTATVERARVPLNGTHPWADVTFTYTGDNSARLSIVDALGFGRGRR